MSDNLKFVLTFLVAVVGGIAAVFAAHRAWLGEWRQRQQMRLNMKREWSSLAPHRESFWTVVRPVYEEFRKSNAVAPKDIESLVRTAGVPPKICRRKGELRQWIDKNKDRLKPHQLTFLEIACSIYPQRMRPDEKLADVTCIPRDRVDQFDQARNKLAHFWDDWGPFTSVRYLRKDYHRSPAELIILSWLEIALQRRTQVEGPGKIGLFRLAAKCKM